MSLIDWVVLVVTFILIISYGLYKSNATKNLEGYFLSNRSMPWYLVLLGIMGTQASAITFYQHPVRPIPMVCVLCNIILAYRLL